MANSLKKVISILGKNRVKLDEPMSSHTYFKIGGPADALFEAKSATDLITAVQASIANKTPYFILGGGSNILVGDKGIRGLVIKNRADKVRTVGFNGKISQKKPVVNQAFVEAESGALLNKLSRYCIEEGLKGLEVFLSVPGTVGGAVFNNSHYRPEKNEFIGNFIRRAIILDERGDKKDVSVDYFKFAYDYSILHKTSDVLLSATFALKGGKRDQIWQRATRLIKRRNTRQPIGIACSGCTFRNISQADALRMGTPDHTQSTGYLIDKAGLKNAQVGKARVSEAHASFIENIGGATASDVLKLIDKIKLTVKAKFGVTLELEIFLVGEF